jgi:hypothetical protein
MEKSPISVFDHFSKAGLVGTKKKKTTTMKKKNKTPAQATAPVLITRTSIDSS